MTATHRKLPPVLNNRYIRQITSTIRLQILELPLSLVIVAHLLLTFFLFSPFLLKGLHIYASTDNKFAYFPHFFLNRRSLLAGDLNFWNPYILSGIDFTTSTHNYMLSPFNWLLMLVPEAYFSTAFTLRMLIELWFLGVFGFLAFNAVIGSRKWAFFASVTYQLSSTMVLGLTLYPAVTTLMLTTLATYLLFTLNQRPPYRSYLGLSLTIAVMILSGQLVYVIQMLFSLAILFAFFTLAYFKDFLTSARHWGIFALVGLTGGLIGSLRLWSFYEALKNSSRLFDNIAALGVRDTIFTNYFAFVPEVLGINYRSSMPILEGIGFQSHIHGWASLYLGVLPILMIVWSLIVIRNNKPVQILSIIFLGVWLWHMNLQPIAGVFEIALFPFIHELSHLYWLPIGMCLLIGYIGKHLEERPPLVGSSNLAVLIAICLFVIGGMVRVWLNTYPDMLSTVRVTAIVVAIGGLCSYVLWHHQLLSELFKKTTLIILNLISLALSGFSLLAFGQALSWGTVFIFAPEVSGVFALSIGYLLTSLAVILSLLVVTLSFIIKVRLRTVMYGVTGLNILILLSILIYPVSLFDKTPTTSETFSLYMLGVIRFILILGLFVTLLILLKAQILSPKLLMPLCLLIILVDLLPFDKVYSRIITEPFFEGSLPYPNSSEALDNIRVPIGYDKLVAPNHNLLHNPMFLELNGEQPVSWVLGGVGQTKVELVKSDGVPQSWLRFVNQGKQTINLFQDIQNPGSFANRRLTLGAWIRSSTPNHVRLLLADEKAAQPSRFHSGNGQWEWLEVSLRIQNPAWVRAHLSITGAGLAEVAGIILAEPPPDSVLLDLESYRVNHPHVLLGLSSNELETNIPPFYGARMYGGVNSAYSERYLGFIKNFEAIGSRSVAGSAVPTDMTNPRFLDLVGARYDADSSGELIIRPTALARFMLFRNYEVIENDDETLARLKAPDFKPQQTVLLNRQPGVTVQDTAEPAKVVKIIQQTPSQVELKVESDQPAVLFFGDSYDPGWHVYINGQKGEISPANYMFMATTVKTGQSTVIFKFVPVAFFQAVKMAGGGTILFLLITWVLWRYPQLGQANRLEEIAKYADL